MSKQILIVEDEPMIGEDLRIVIEGLGYQVIDIVDNAVDALKIINKEKVDLVFLDVQIKGDLDGIQLAEQIKAESAIPFLFLTSYFDDDTVYRIRKVKPLGYIVKPFKDSDIKVNLGLAFNQLEKVKEKSDEIMELFIRKNGELKRVLPQDILWIKGEDNYSIIHCVNGEKHTITQTLKSLEAKFQQSGFVRIQKGYVIQLAGISSISGNTIYIGTENFPIGKAYRRAFFDLITVL